MERILLQLASDNNAGLLAVVHQIQEQTLKRLVMLLIAALAPRSFDDLEDNDEEDEKPDVRIPPLATATTFWLVGEWLTEGLASLGSVLGNFDKQKRPVLKLLALLLSIAGCNRQAARNLFC